MIIMFKRNTSSSHYSSSLLLIEMYKYLVNSRIKLLRLNYCVSTL